MFGNKAMLGVDLPTTIIFVVRGSRELCYVMATCKLHDINTNKMFVKLTQTKTNISFRITELIQLDANACAPWPIFRAKSLLVHGNLP